MIERFSEWANEWMSKWAHVPTTIVYSLSQNVSALINICLIVRLIDQMDGRLSPQVNEFVHTPSIYKLLIWLVYSIM